MANLFSEKPIVKTVMLKGQDGEEKLINQADGSGVSFWIGTQAEYDAIPPEELIENCVYYITDNTADNIRTDLNALDTKVDNHYTELDERIDEITGSTKRYTYDDLTSNAQDVFSGLSCVDVFKRGGFIFLAFKLYTKAEIGANTLTSIIENNEIAAAYINANNKTLYFKGLTTEGRRKISFYYQVVNGVARLNVEAEEIIPIGDEINCSIIYPAEEV